MRANSADLNWVIFQVTAGDFKQSRWISPLHSEADVDLN
jgi:hypothetical protein